MKALLVVVTLSFLVEISHGLVQVRGPCDHAYFRVEDGPCQECPWCPSGEGWDIDCRPFPPYRRNEPLPKCSHCTEGFFSSHYSQAVCDPCQQNCSLYINKVETQACDATHNRHCECHPDYVRSAKEVCDVRCDGKCCDDFPRECTQRGFRCHRNRPDGTCVLPTGKPHTVPTTTKIVTEEKTMSSSPGTKQNIDRIMKPAAIGKPDEESTRERNTPTIVVPVVLAVLFLVVFVVVVATVTARRNQANNPKSSQESSPSTSIRSNVTNVEEPLLKTAPSPEIVVDDTYSIVGPFLHQLKYGERMEVAEPLDERGDDNYQAIGLDIAESYPNLPDLKDDVINCRRYFYGGGEMMLVVFEMAMALKPNFTMAEFNSMAEELLRPDIVSYIAQNKLLRLRLDEVLHEHLRRMGNILDKRLERGHYWRSFADKLGLSDADIKMIERGQKEPQKYSPTREMIDVLIRYIPNITVERFQDAASRLRRNDIKAKVDRWIDEERRRSTQPGPDVDRPSQKSPPITDSDESQEDVNTPVMNSQRQTHVAELEEMKTKWREVVDMLGFLMENPNELSALDGRVRELEGSHTDVAARLDRPIPNLNLEERIRVFEDAANHENLERMKQQIREVSEVVKRFMNKQIQYADLDERVAVLEDGADRSASTNQCKGSFQTYQRVSG